MHLIIGSHVQVAGSDMLVGAVNAAISYGANTFMFYTGAPQNTVRKPITTFRIEEAKNIMNAHNINPEHIMVHAPYIINMANTSNPQVMTLAIDFLQEEMRRVAQLGFRYLIIHPGSHVGNGIEAGQNQIVKIINQVLNEDLSSVTLLLETMSGKGTEIGYQIEQLCQIIHSIQKKDRIGVCLDTCHLHDAGYDIADFDSILDTIDHLIGIQYIKAVHVNDSKNERASKKDRHENLGFGRIGFESLLNVIYNERLKNIPKILETPWINDYPPYLEEITMIKNKIFNPNLQNQLLEKKV